MRTRTLTTAVAALAMASVAVVTAAGQDVRPAAEPGPAAAGSWVAGFYSGGLKPVPCWGACAPGSKGARDEAATRKRMAELKALNVRYVVNNETVVEAYRTAPRAFLAYLADLHAAGIAVSYSIASGEGAWVAGAVFGTARANALFAKTDLDGDGVSDLDGRLDVLYQGHEVLEWATHDERVAIYGVAKKWFPTTPVSVYYAGFARPTDPRFRAVRHPRGGVWADYAYGPGEADIVHLGIRRNASGTTIDGATGKAGWNPVAFRAEVVREVALVEAATPGRPVYVSTNIAGDTTLKRSAAAMWTPGEIGEWWAAVTSVPGVRGLMLRSYGRFPYDLAYPAFTAQRATWAALAAPPPAPTTEPPTTEPPAPTTEPPTTEAPPP